MSAFYYFLLFMVRDSISSISILRYLIMKNPYHGIIQGKGVFLQKIMKDNRCIAIFFVFFLTFRSGFWATNACNGNQAVTAVF